MTRVPICSFILLPSLLPPPPAFASDGAARVKADAILATDTDTLAKPTMNSRAMRAAAWRAAPYSDTADWHRVDNALYHPVLQPARLGYPQAVNPASSGPAQHCVVDPIEEIQTEVANPATELQLERAGVSLAFILNAALAAQPS